MTRLISRRRLGCAICAAALTGLSAGAAAAGRRPWCRFSLIDGWSASARTFNIVRLAGQDDPSGVPQATRRILDVLSFRTEFDIWLAEGENNAMTTIENGRRTMVVDVDFLLRMNNVARTRWAAIAVLAHEVGHHLGARSDDPHQNELQADYWSGRTLRLLGSARSAATLAVLAFGNDVDTESHPNKYARVRAVERGWDA